MGEFYENRVRKLTDKYYQWSQIITIWLLSPTRITNVHDDSLCDKILLYFHDVLDACFEIRDEAYGGSLGPTLTVWPYIRLTRL